MRLAQRLILLVGLVILGVLLWKMDAREVLAAVVSVGLWFPVIIVQEISAHLFNAIGWRFAMRPRHAQAYSVSTLLKFRVIGDGVNYLTPSATIAGEFARASLLDGGRSFDVRLGGVVAAKFAQAVAQFLFVLCGVAWVVNERIEALAPYETAFQVAATCAVVLLFGFIAWEKRREVPRDTPDEELPGGFKGMPRQLKSFVHDHPGRAATSTIMFLLGYAWNTVEVWLICHALGAPVDLRTALAVEVLSNIIDGLLFMVPAKVGTQEAGKTAIFHVLGMNARTGFAFGVVRHIRELAWAGLGLWLYSRLMREKSRAEKDAPAAQPPGGFGGPLEPVS